MVQIDTKRCVGCGNCVDACPFGVLELQEGKAIIKHPEKCKGCGACIAACPNNAISAGN